MGEYRMTFYAQNSRTGHRRYDARAARAGQLAEAFDGLSSDVSHRQVLTAFKRAAPFLGISSRLAHAIDTLMAWSRAVDWTNGQRPIVFPSNETLSLKLGISVRQVQKLLNEGVALGLLWHRDSANGNRIGARGQDGRLIYAYGIDLSPLGSRYSEFLRVAERGSAENRRIDVLRKRLTAARRRIYGLSQVVLNEGMTSIDGQTPLEIAQLATRQMRSVRDERILEGCVVQIEQEAARLGATVAGMFEAVAVDPLNESPSDELYDTPNTATNQPSIAKANIRNELPKSLQGPCDVRHNQSKNDVEADLLRHGVDPSFIVSAAPELIPAHMGSAPSWGDLITVAERWATQTNVHRHIWDEACQIMGEKGAAASVLATSWKHLRGDVERPGAYLRGMNSRAAVGKLNLGRTFHGLRNHASAEMKPKLFTATPDSRSIGRLVSSALKSVQLDRGLS